MSFFQWDDIDQGAANIMIGKISNIDRANLKADVESLSLTSVPIHYHCSEEVLEDNGDALKNVYPNDQDLEGAGAFSSGDDVLVMYTEPGNKEPYIIGFPEESRECGIEILTYNEIWYGDMENDDPVLWKDAAYVTSSRSSDQAFIGPYSRKIEVNLPFNYGWMYSAILGLPFELGQEIFTSFRFYITSPGNIQFGLGPEFGVRTMPIRYSWDDAQGGWYYILPTGAPAPVFGVWNEVTFSYTVEANLVGPDPRFVVEFTYLPGDHGPVRPILYVDDVNVKLLS